MLPPEISTLIFQLVLRRGEIDPWDHSHLEALTPAVSSLDKKTSAEVSRILYGENIFDLRLSSRHQTASFFSTIGQKNAQNIKHVRINGSICPKTSQLDEESENIIFWMRSFCGRLKTVTVSMPKHGNVDAQAAPRSVTASRVNDIVTIYCDNAQSSTSNTEHMKAKQRVFDQCLDPRYPKTCFELKGLCDEHPHVLHWVNGHARVNILHYRQIYLTILCRATDIKETYMPDRRRTIISANGRLCHVEWKRFALDVFNKPEPTDALQATLSFVLCNMAMYTEKKSRSEYDRRVTKSSEVFSRRDIQSVFLQARALDLDAMLDKIKQIRLLDYIDERKEYEEDAGEKSEEEPIIDPFGLDWSWRTN